VQKSPTRLGLSLTAALAALLLVGCSQQGGESGGGGSAGGGSQEAGDHAGDHGDHEGDHAGHGDHSEHGGEHGDHGADAPEDFDAAVAQVSELRDTIVSALEADDAEAAHDPLHDIGHTLEHVERYAGDLDLSEAEQEKVDSAINSLFDAFGSIDEQFHGGEGKSLDEVRDSIDASMETLRQHVSGDE